MLRRGVLLLLASAWGLLARAEEPPPVVAEGDTLSGSWVRQLAATRFDFADERIKYPRFVRFCLGVYDWANRNFNTFDPEYVVSPSKSCRAQIKSYNWIQTYAYDFEVGVNSDATSGNRIVLRSGSCNDLGVQFNVSLLSVGYSWNVNKWFHGEHDKRDTYNLSLTTSRFSFDFTATTNSTYGTVINSSLKNMKMPMEQVAYDVSAYYFFNYKRYSQAAAYGFSKIQLRSAGSWLLGLNYARQNISIDFDALPEEAFELFPGLPGKARYRFQNYNVTGGYAYNFVVGPKGKWLLNVMGLPYAGYRHQPHKRESRREVLSTGILARGSVVFNHRSLFAGLLVSIDGSAFFTAKYSFFNSTETATLHLGVRF